MNKKLVTLFAVWTILSILISAIVIHFAFVPSIRNFEINSKHLGETQKLIQTDFEQIYNQDNYKIYSSKNGITVEIDVNNAILKCYYTADKQFISFEITGAPIYVDTTSRIVVLICIIVLSIIFSILLIGLFIGTSNIIYKFLKRTIKRRH